MHNEVTIFVKYAAWYVYSLENCGILKLRLELFDQMPTKVRLFNSDPI
jgi:hypothetical protein